MASLFDPILYTKRRVDVHGSGTIDLLLVDDLKGYVVKVYNRNPEQGCGHSFLTYEEAQACYLDAFKVLTNKNVNFLQVADVIMRPPFHPELNL